MRSRRDIYWDDFWQLNEGCTPCSPGCARCWSARRTNRLSANPRIKNVDKKKGLVTSDLKFNGQIRLREDLLDLPFKTKNPTTFFILNDLFHEDIPDAFIADAYSVMHGCDRHTYLNLTKRADRLLAFFQTSFMQSYQGRDHIWNILTVCNQEEADRKIPKLLQIPGKKGLSIEPMLGAIDLTITPAGMIMGECDECGSTDNNPNCECCHGLGSISAVILGGESGTGARPMHPDWVRSVRDQCQAAGVSFFFKQWGEYQHVPDLDGRGIPSPFGDGTVMRRVGKKKAGRLLDGRTHDDLPWLNRLI
jgi:protein gp37